MEPVDLPKEWRMSLIFSLSSSALLTVSMTPIQHLDGLSDSLYQVNSGSGGLLGSASAPPDNQTATITFTSLLTAGQYSLVLSGGIPPNSPKGDVKYVGTLVITPTPTNPPVITGISTTNGQLNLVVQSTANYTNVVQYSTNLSSLSNWISVSTNIVPANNYFMFVDSNINFSPVRFYRIQQQ